MVPKQLSTRKISQNPPPSIHPSTATRWYESPISYDLHPHPTPIGSMTLVYFTYIYLSACTRPMGSVMGMVIFFGQVLQFFQGTRPSDSTAAKAPLLPTTRRNARGPSRRGPGKGDWDSWPPHHQTWSKSKVLVFVGWFLLEILFTLGT